MTAIAWLPAALYLGVDIVPARLRPAAWRPRLDHDGGVVRAPEGGRPALRLTSPATHVSFGVFRACLVWRRRP